MIRGLLLGALFALVHSVAIAATGLTELSGLAGDGPVTVFYPSSSKAEPYRRGPFTFQVAHDGVPERANGRLVIVSHGSGGSPWPHGDLARALVDAGFTVAMPEHRGDNHRDGSKPGPESWKRRPAEVSRAIDAVARDPRFAPLLALDKVGVYGMSAGGHTALTMAGGRWSPSALSRHCEVHIAEDFPACVGLSAQLRGDVLDVPKMWVALSVIRWRFSDLAWYTYSDPRVAAVVAGVPYAADFDLASLASPRVPLGLVTAGRDQWLAPRYHSSAVLQACKSCELVADIPDGGHGALLSPLPPLLPAAAAELLNDPPGFDRSKLPDVDRRIAAFLRKHLVP